MSCLRAIVEISLRQVRRESGFGRDCDAGSASLSLIGVASVVTMLLAGLLIMTAAAVAQNRTDGLADRAALAAADSRSGRIPGWPPCAAAERALGDSGGHLLECFQHPADPADTNTLAVSVLVELAHDSPWGIWRHRSWATAG